MPGVTATAHWSVCHLASLSQPASQPGSHCLTARPGYTVRAAQSDTATHRGGHSHGQQVSRQPVDLSLSASQPASQSRQGQSAHLKAASQSPSVTTSSVIQQPIKVSQPISTLQSVSWQETVPRPGSGALPLSRVALSQSSPSHAVPSSEGCRILPLQRLSWVVGALSQTSQLDTVSFCLLNSQSL